MKRFVLLLVLMFCDLGIAPGAEVERSPKVDPWVRETTANGATPEFIVFLADQVILLGSSPRLISMARIRDLILPLA